MKSMPIDDFDLAATLESGQIFRYVRLHEGYLVHHRHRVFQILQKGRVLFFDGTDEAFLTHFLALDENYREVTRCLSAEATLRKVIERYWGLRILRQDPWECLISFLCSSTKSITHIKVILERLCRSFGKAVSLGHYQGYGFPSEGAMDDRERLKEIGLGFRAGYVHSVNQIIRDGYFEKVLRAPYEEARGRLMRLPGVGDKIADCVLLFSMGFSQAFPVDTWIKRGMERAYFHGKSTPPGKIRAFSKTHLAPFAGYAQQFLYHYWRTIGKVPEHCDEAAQ